MPNSEVAWRNSLENSKILFRNFFNFKKCMGYLAPNYNDIYTTWFSHDIQNNYSWIHPPTGK